MNRRPPRRYRRETQQEQIKTALIVGGILIGAFLLLQLLRALGVDLLPGMF